ncbi:acyl-CoA N-acyltransferase [Paraphoma chrysanthemicola]|nr:acyl-CoA N-acyltransferase [Paraphoma chrysanthemicola]
MTLTSTTHRLRACQTSDIPAIRDIAEHYVNNTVITLALEPPLDDDIAQSWRRSVAEGLPYIVAVDEQDAVLGFCSAGLFRGGGGRGGYRHTVELSLFCHPGHMKEGIGSALLQKVIDILRAPDQFPDFIDTPRAEHSSVRAVLACMSIDETMWKNGLGLRDFYVKHGFKEVGHMKNVGHKFDRWIDTLYLQFELW